jgi:hypothetical protein
VSGDDTIRELSQIVNLLAEVMMRTVEGCMVAQISGELIDSRLQIEQQVGVKLNQPSLTEASSFPPPRLPAKARGKGAPPNQVIERDV